MLVNSILLAMPLYLMFFYLLPVSVKKKLNKIRRKFFKGMTDNKWFFFIGGRFANQRK